MPQITKDHRGGGRFTPEQISQTIAQYKIQATSQFSAEQIALACLHAKATKRPQLKKRAIGSRRNHRSYSYGDCHWAS